jgi:hypothetical protein
VAELEELAAEGGDASLFSNPGHDGWNGRECVEWERWMTGVFREGQSKTGKKINRKKLGELTFFARGSLSRMRGSSTLLLPDSIAAFSRTIQCWLSRGWVYNYRVISRISESRLLFKVLQSDMMHRQAIGIPTMAIQVETGQLRDTRHRNKS